MKKTIPAILAMLALSAAALLSGCATKTDSIALYDFGPLHAARQAQADLALPALPPISVADIGTPAWLDTTTMFFRLSYANEQQPRPYANSRWTMPPAQLFAQRLKSRIAQAGGAALSASDGALNVPVLRIEADDFMQQFDAPERSNGQIGLRAALFNGRTLIAQKSFVKQAPAPSADAAGGARALAAASDAIINEMMSWLASVPSTRTSQASK
jgi:cholesterol transport system auxiliary component